MPTIGHHSLSPDIQEANYMLERQKHLLEKTQDKKYRISLVSSAFSFFLNTFTLSLRKRVISDLGINILCLLGFYHYQKLVYPPNKNTQPHEGMTADQLKALEKQLVAEIERLEKTRVSKDEILLSSPLLNIALKLGRLGDASYRDRTKKLIACLFFCLAASIVVDEFCKFYYGNSPIDAIDAMMNTLLSLLLPSILSVVLNYLLVDPLIDSYRHKVAITLKKNNAVLLPEKNRELTEVRERLGTAASLSTRLPSNP